MSVKQEFQYTIIDKKNDSALKNNLIFQNSDLHDLKPIEPWRSVPIRARDYLSWALSSGGNQ